MMPRVVPALLISNGGLVKTRRFKEPVYIGDPMNAVRIFNEKKVDELFLLDIDASNVGRSVSHDLVRQVSEEAAMPFAVGGGVSTVEEARSLLRLGAERIVVGSAAHADPTLIDRISAEFGASSLTVAVDVRTGMWSRRTLRSRGGRRKEKGRVEEWAVEVAERGAGEILLNSVDRDGTRAGYDIDLIREVSDRVSIPVTALGGAGGLEDFRSAVEHGGASAVAAGSLFVFHGKLDAVLINYPTAAERESLWGDGAR